MVTVNIDVDIELEDFDDVDLIEELKKRGYVVLESEEDGELIESDINGCKIMVNGDTREFNGLTTIAVYAK